MLSLQVDSDAAGSHPGQPLTIPLDKYRCTILGRLKPATLPPDSQFVLLDSPTLRNLTSRQHLKITCTPVEVDDGLSFEYALEDLKSMNGVLVNKRKVDRCVLADGDVLIIGAAKNAEVGQTISRDLTGASDLVYRFTADANAPTTATVPAAAEGPTLPRRTSSATAQLRPILSPQSSITGAPAATGAAAVDGVESKQAEGAAAASAPRRTGTVSNKASARSRRRAINGASAEPAPSSAEASADAASSASSSADAASAASSSAAAAAAAASSSPARAASPTPTAAAAADSDSAAANDSAPAAEGEGSSRPKVSLASHLLSFASTLNPFRSRGSPEPAAAAAPEPAEAEGASSSSSSAAAAGALVDSAERRKKRLRDELDAMSAAGAGAGPSAEGGAAADGAHRDSESAKRQRAESPCIDMTVDSHVPVAAGSAADAIAAAASSNGAVPAAAAAAAAAATPAASSSSPAVPTRTGSMAASEARKQMATELSEEFVCAVCCELLVHAHALSCSHTFCKSCLAQWLATGSGAAGSKTCPACRSAIASDPVPVKSLDNAIDIMAKAALTEEELAERKEKQAKDASVIMPKVAAAGGGAGGAGRGGPGAAAAAAALARLGPMGGFPMGSFGFGGFGGGGGYGGGAYGLGAGFPYAFGAMPAAAAPAAGAGARAAPVAVDDDDDDGDDGGLDDVRRGVSVRLERARSGRSRCRTCNAFIAHGEVRMAVMEPAEFEYYESERFYHVACYAPQVSRRDYPNAPAIPGFERLTPPEKALVQRAFPA